MFATPKIGQQITVITDWSDYFKPFGTNVRRKHTATGKVVTGEGWDKPNTFRMTTGNVNHPVAVVPLKRVISLVDADGVEADASAVDDIDNQSNTWEVKGSTGSSYIVTQNGDRWSCTCKGYMFRNSCKHIGQFREE